jgi:hypothetical protein
MNKLDKWINDNKSSNKLMKLPTEFYNYAEVCFDSVLAEMVDLEEGFWVDTSCRKFIRNIHLCNNVGIS